MSLMPEIPRHCDECRDGWHVGTYEGDDGEVPINDVLWAPQDDITITDAHGSVVWITVLGAARFDVKIRCPVVREAEIQAKMAHP